MNIRDQQLVYTSVSAYTFESLHLHYSPSRKRHQLDEAHAIMEQHRGASERLLDTEDSDRYDDNDGSPSPSRRKAEKKVLSRSLFWIASIVLGISLVSNAATFLHATNFDMDLACDVYTSQARK